MNIVESESDECQSFDIVSEKEKLRLYYLELKREKEEQQVEKGRIARAGSNGSRHLELYAKGKHDVATKRELEVAAQVETHLVVSEVDHCPNHKCNLLYKDSREEISKHGKEKRTKVEIAQALSNPKPPPAPRVPPPSKMKYEVTSPEEIVKRLYTTNTISLDMQRASRSNSIHRGHNSRSSSRNSRSEFSSDDKQDTTRNFAIRSSSPTPRDMAF